jgi:hypothetical protein
MQNAAFQALVAARADLPPILADAVNESCDGHQYASLEALQAAINPILTQHGLFPNFRGHGQQGVELVLTHLETGDQYGSGPVIPCVSHNVHDQGTANTYGRKYAYLDLFNLMVEKDLDGNRPSSRSVPKPQPKPQEGKTLADCTSSKELQDRIQELQLQYPIAQHLDKWRVSLPVIEKLIADKKWTAAGLAEAVARIKGSLSFVEAGKEHFSGEVISPP